MKRYRLLLFLTIAVVFSLIAGCTGGASVATSWPGFMVDVDRETVYVSFNAHVYAVNLGNGSEKWRFPQEADNKITFHADPTITEDDQLIVGAYNNILYSINPENGAQNWTFAGAKNRYVGGALSDKNSIFAPSSDNNLYTVSPQGNLRWQAATGSSLWATPISDGEFVYQPSMDHHLYIFDIESGNEVWKSDDWGGTMVSQPLLDPTGVLYQGTFGNELIALDTARRQILWRFPAQGWIWSTPVIHEDRLYFGDLEGTVYAINAADGSLVWQIQPDTSNERGIFGSPIVEEDTLYFASRAGILYAVDKSNGNPRWNKPFEAEFFSNLIKAGDLILLGAHKSDSPLIAVDFSGNQRWSFIPQK